MWKEVSVNGKRLLKECSKQQLEGRHRQFSSLFACLLTVILQTQDWKPLLNCCTAHNHVAGSYLCGVPGIYTAFIFPGPSNTCKLLRRVYNLQLHKPKENTRSNQSQYPMYRMPAESGNPLGRGNNPRKQVTYYATKKGEGKPANNKSPTVFSKLMWRDILSWSLITSYDRKGAGWKSSCFHAVWMMLERGKLLPPRAFAPMLKKLLLILLGGVFWFVFYTPILSCSGFSCFG